MKRLHPPLMKRLVATSVAAVLAGASPALASGPGLVFSGNPTSYASFNCAGFPAGDSPRTLEAWLRIPVSTGPVNARGSVIELGQQQGTGSAFGLQVEGTRVGFWGHNADQRQVVEIPDDQWHHVALTYANQQVAIYLDGALKGTWANRPPSTSVGPPGRSSQEPHLSESAGQSGGVGTVHVPYSKLEPE